MTIRGFSARTDMFVDGVRDTGGYSRDTFNVEQVEVAKGPSSAIAGRGSTGASINLVSKTPRLTPGYGVTAEGGNADFRRSTVDLNQPLSRDRGNAIRLNAMWTDAGVPGRDRSGEQELGVCALAGVRPDGPDPVDAQLPAPVAGQRARLRTAVGAGRQRAARRLRQRRRRPSTRATTTDLKGRDYEKIQNHLATVQFEQRLGVRPVSGT